MFDPVTQPLGTRMLSNSVTLKTGVKFVDVAKMCSDSKELGYDMLWQGSTGNA
jgi:hypothetical protein